MSGRVNEAVGAGGGGGAGGSVRRCVAVGVDPGIANTGLAAVAAGSDPSAGGGVVYLTRGVRHVRTKPDTGKGQRRGTDDVRRTGHIVRAFIAVLDRLQPHCVGIEQYTVFSPPWVGKLSVAGQRLLDLEAAASVRGTGPQARIAAAATREWGEAVEAVREALSASGGGGVGLGQAAKTLAVWGAVVGACVSRGVPVYVFTPGDVKRRATGGRSAASKAEVQTWVSGVVVGLDEDLRGVPASHQDHVADAAALAVLAIEEHGLVESVGG